MKWKSDAAISFFLIHGNHEERASNIGTYREKIWHGGIVYYEEEFPDLLFAKDGELYDFNGKRGIAIGGAYSVDKVDKATEVWLEEIRRRLQYGIWYFGHFHGNRPIILSCPMELCIRML